MLSLGSIVFGCCDIAHAALTSGEISLLGVLSLALAFADVARHHWLTHGHIYRD